MYERKVKCNYCSSVFYEDYIIAHENGEDEICPVCNHKGMLSDDTWTVRVSGDRNESLIKAIMDLSKENRKALRQVVQLIPNDGYPVHIYEI